MQWKQHCNHLFIARTLPTVITRLAFQTSTMNHPPDQPDKNTFPSVHEDKSVDRVISLAEEGTAQTPHVNSIVVDVSYCSTNDASTGTDLTHSASPLLDVQIGEERRQRCQPRV